MDSAQKQHTDKGMGKLVRECLKKFPVAFEENTQNKICQHSCSKPGVNLILGNYYLSCSVQFKNKKQASWYINKVSQDFE
jgi:hypothetical protein